VVVDPERLTDPSVDWADLVPQDEDNDQTDDDDSDDGEDTDEDEDTDKAAD
jgi:hypothetical protein